MEIVALALVAAAASAWLCDRMLGRLPHVADEISYLFQGRIFAAGRLWLAPPSLPQLFEFDHIVLSGGKWCSIYPPGWPLLLAAGWLVRAPWIVNPVLLFLSVIGTWRLAVLLFDVRTARAAVVLFVSSPFVLLMHAGFMAHPAALCSAIWCAVLLVRGRDSGNDAHDFAAGVVAGICFLVRPATCVALLWPLLLWICRERRSVRPALAAAAGFLPGLLLFLIYNQMLFGHPFVAGYRLDNSYPLQSLTARLVGESFVWYFRSLDRWAWEWPWPALVIFAPLVLQRTHWWETVMLIACSVSLVVVYCMFPYRDIVYAGPRYAFESMAFLSILAARALSSLVDSLARNRVPVRPAATTLVAVLCATVSLSQLPHQVEFHSQMYHSRSHELVMALRKSQIGDRALIRIGGNPYVYGSFLLENALEPETGGRVFVRDLAGQEAAARKAFPRDEVWKITIEMQPIPGPNSYPDRWSLTQFQMQRESATSR